MRTLAMAGRRIKAKVTTDPKLIERARAAWQDEGSIEIDDDAPVSRSTGGAYVQAWIWIEDPEDELPSVFICQQCGQHITDGKPCGCGTR